jgi:sec-independent protein translocase protein TatB
VFNIGGGEILLVMLVAMVVLGPERLPKAARDVGRAIAQFRRLTSGVQSDLRDAMGADEFRESMESLRSVVDLKSSIKGELQGLSSSLTSAISSTADTAISGTIDTGSVNASVAESLSISSGSGSGSSGSGSSVLVAAGVELIPPPDGMFVGDVVEGSLGLESVPSPALGFDDVHPVARALDSRPRLGAWDSYV